MWLAFAAGSALFSGLTAVLAKCGIRKTDSTIATAIRTVVVLVFSWLMVVLVGSQGQITHIEPRTWVFLILSGLATGASWLCYFRALQLGDINKVTPIDKSSTVLTMILGVVLLGEPFGATSAIAIALIGTGTLLMVEQHEGHAPDRDHPAANSRGSKTPDRHSPTATRPQLPAWLIYAALSAVFAALTAILGKVGIQGIDSNLGTAIRTCVVLVMAWLMVGVSGKGPELRRVPPRELAFICLSGIATGAAWLCYYRALQEGPASVVAPIDKLSILVTIAFSRVVFDERLSRRAAAGLALVVAGTTLTTLG